ncbi:hypothetical protein [Roseitranquillus sediminis]|uniref:hypothetical protein n=1 Tax=Roseitranquillus sediminis TaxID=2809051 RepID=UPI001D0CD0E7|nr:hypothetical protein [Roseitranquillus sediminis]MBM9594963.1 hypothetical protein [Roseitranquillus sediminis]
MRGPLLALVCIAASPTAAQDTRLFDCGTESRPMIVGGSEAPSGCVSVDTEALELERPAPALDDLARRLDEQEARIHRLERQVQGMAAPAYRPMPLPRMPAADPYDTRGRLRDLGQDIDRKLDALGR